MSSNALPMLPAPPKVVLLNILHEEWDRDYTIPALNAFVEYGALTSLHKLLTISDVSWPPKEGDPLQTLTIKIDYREESARLQVFPGAWEAELEQGNYPEPGKKVISEACPEWGMDQETLQAKATEHLARAERLVKSALKHRAKLEKPPPSRMEITHVVNIVTCDVGK